MGRRGLGKMVEENEGGKGISRSASKHGARVMGAEKNDDIDNGEPKN